MKAVLLLSLGILSSAHNVRHSSTLLRSDTATGSAAPSATGSAAPSATSAATGGSSLKNEKWLSNIHQSIDTLKTFAAEKDQERDTVCQREFAAIKSEQAQEDADEKKDKANQKQNLADALDSRINGMAAGLNKLMALQKQLKGHIDNVNLIFQAKYAQDQRDMEVAGEAFESLMNHATEGNPKDKPIKVPAMPALNISFVEVGLTTGVYSERLSRMKARLDRHMSENDELPQCADAHQAALALFHKGARYHEEIKQFFAAERKVLASFREQLANVLRSKLAKLAKLKAQSAKLKNAMKVKEVDMKKALGEALAAHETIVHAACSQMDAHTQSNGPKRKMLIEKSNQCSKSTGTGAGVTLGNGTETLAGKVEEVEEEVVATTKESGGEVAATGSATGLGEDAASTDGAEEQLPSEEEHIVVEPVVEPAQPRTPAKKRMGKVITV